MAPGPADPANQLVEDFSKLGQPSRSRRKGRVLSNRRRAHHSLKQSQYHDAEEGPTSEEECDSDDPSVWSPFPDDIQDHILAKLEIRDLFQAKRVSWSFRLRIESDGFHDCRGKMRAREAFLTALHFLVGKDGVWLCRGYDLDTETWTRLPPFDFLPKLDPSLFKDHSICGARGFMCANVSTSSSLQEKIVIFNPMTRRWRTLPPLNHPRNPVLMHMVVDDDNSYRIIVAGSARAGQEHLSKVTEVFDSRTSKWTVTQELPGPFFALNEHQTGVYVNGILFCIAFLDAENSGKGLIAYNVEEEKWLPHLTCPLLHSTNLSIVQLVEYNGKVVVFSEIERNPYVGNVEHRMDLLESVVCTDESGQGTGTWRNVMTETKVGNQAGLQTYPEYSCVPFGDGKLCIFNTIARTGIVYDVSSGKRVETLSSPPCSEYMGFYSMNPVTFSFEPTFKGNPNSPQTSVPCFSPISLGSV